MNCLQNLSTDKNKIDRIDARRMHSYPLTLYMIFQLSMKNTKKNKKLFTLSDTEKVSDNVGSVWGSRSRLREGDSQRMMSPNDRDRPKVGSSERNENSANVKSGEKFLATVTKGTGQCEKFFPRLHSDDLKTKWNLVEKEADRLQKPAGLVADGQTKTILADVPKSQVTSATAEKYRRAALKMLADDVTPLEKATTRQHWNFLRTAMKFHMVETIHQARQKSEKARKAGNLEEAKRLTRYAFETATVLDAMFIQPGHPVWADKIIKQRTEGFPPHRKKSKRFGPSAPSAQRAYIEGLNISKMLINRHVERLFILDLFGLRPAEMMHPDGVRLAIKEVEGQTQILAIIHGAKVSKTRGIDLRVCGRVLESFDQPQRAFISTLVDRVRASDGLTIHTSPSDYRSLNRLLTKLQPGLSCYSFRHKVASDLKGSETPIGSAGFMGHASTKSLESYGRREKGRGSQGYLVNTNKEPRHGNGLTRSTNMEKHQKIKKWKAKKAQEKYNFPKSPAKTATANQPSALRSPLTTMKPKLPS